MRLTWAVAGIIVSRWRIRGTFPSVSVYIYLDLIQGMHWCVWAWMADRVVVYFYSQSKAWTSLQMTACNWGLGGSQIKEFDSACATTLCCTITIRSVPEWVKFGVVLKLGSVFNQVWKHKNVKTLPELLNIVLIVVIFKKSKKKKKHGADEWHNAVVTAVASSQMNKMPRPQTLLLLQPPLLSQRQRV